jgi:high-affinity nickel-transport protein
MHQTRERHKEMKKILTGVALLHIIGWGIFFTLGFEEVTLATALLAYTLGMRHAFDADHLVAIDGTTRKLIHEHKDSHGVGFFFSLGHSTVVFIATALAVTGISTIGADLLNEDSTLKQTGGFIGGLVAGSFLLLLAAWNLRILWKILAGDKEAHPHGIISRFVKPVNKQWQMYPVGLLFGLGFDTATSITFLSLSIVSVASGSLTFAVLSLPIIFTAGMALGDSLSGYVMSKSMKWAIAKDQRKTYNIVLTLTASLAAIAIGLPILLEL